MKLKFHTIILFIVVPIADLKMFQSSSFFTSIPPFRRDYFVCTGCGAYSCGGLYSSICSNCNGIIADPPRNIRNQYLCTNCARRRRPCNCGSSVVVVSPSNSAERNPPEYCWCPCCTCCSYSCSCSCCAFFCECLSSPCKPFAPCCYCTRVCCPDDRCCCCRCRCCCDPWRCFWSWCSCMCSPPQYKEDKNSSSRHRTN